MSSGRRTAPRSAAGAADGLPEGGSPGWGGGAHVQTRNRLEETLEPATHLGRSRLGLALVLALGTIACTGGESHFYEEFEAELYSVVTHAGDCPEAAPFAFQIGDGCPTICSPHEILQPAEAQAVLDENGASCATVLPKLTCKQACFGDWDECEAGPDGCKVKKKTEPTPGCCSADGDCDAGSVCVDGAAGKGSCELAAPAGKCWSDADCKEAQTCEGANTCPCDMDCMTVNPGSCKPLDGPCCFEDTDCGDSMVCVPQAEGKPGRCGEAPKVGACWADSDCEVGESCASVMKTCPCDLEECEAFQPGVCSAPLPPPCCLEEGSKTPSCLEIPLGPGKCASNADCGADAQCTGAVICACGEPCPEFTLGSCTGFPGCCATDSDCTGGEICAGEPGGPWRCEPPPVGEGACWKDADCAEGSSCAGAMPCPCNEVCVEHAPGTCQPDTVPGEFGAPCDAHSDCISGWCVESGEGKVCTTPCIEECPDGWMCEAVAGPTPDVVFLCVPDDTPPPTGACCKSDTDCDEGTVCTLSDPEGAQGTCELAPSAGECWKDSDCGPSGECFGEMICPCGALCFGVKTGKCIIGGEGCCESSADCDGLAVCVPTGDGMGACEQPPKLGECWTDADCPAGLSCNGALTCPCDMDCSDVAPGICTGFVDGCCLTDAHCDDGKVCATPVGETGTCQAAAPEGECWSNADCGKGLVCNGAQTCGCEAECKNIAPGDCEAPSCPGDVLCLDAAPVCAPPLIAIPKDGCWGCGYPETCSCDDGPVMCAAMPPTCPAGTIVAAQGGCWACVDPLTCS